MRLTTLVCALCLTIGAVSAWAQNATVNIKGVIVDERTNQTVGKDFDVIISSKNTGKKYTVKVNSKTGDFLQPLASGDTYTITFSSYLIYKKVDTIDIPATQKYREERHTFRIRTIVAGEQLANVCAFEPGQSEIAATSMSDMQALLDAIKQNRELQVTMYLAQEQNPPPPEPKKTKAPAKKPAKSKKGAEPPPDPTPAQPAFQPIDSHLNDVRIEALKKFFNQAKNAEIRIRYELAPAMMAAPGQKNLVCKVGEVKSILDD